MNIQIGKWPGPMFYNSYPCAAGGATQYNAIAFDLDVATHPDNAIYNLRFGGFTGNPKVSCVQISSAALLDTTHVTWNDVTIDRFGGNGSPTPAVGYTCVTDLKFGHHNTDVTVYPGLQVIDAAPSMQPGGWFVPGIISSMHAETKTMIISSTTLNANETLWVSWNECNGLYQGLG